MVDTQRTRQYLLRFICVVSTNLEEFEEGNDQCADILNKASLDVGKRGLGKAFQFMKIHFLQPQGRLSTGGLRNRQETNLIEETSIC